MTQTTILIIVAIYIAISVYLAHWDWGVIAARLREGPKVLAKLWRLITATQFAAGLLIVTAVAAIYPTAWPYGQSVKGYYERFGAEAFGIAITVLIIDRLVQNRQ